jgi:hypothetical protein
MSANGLSDLDVGGIRPPLFSLDCHYTTFGR